MKTLNNVTHADMKKKYKPNIGCAIFMFFMILPLILRVGWIQFINIIILILMAYVFNPVDMEKLNIKERCFLLLHVILASLFAYDYGCGWCLP